MNPRSTDRSQPARGPRAIGSVLGGLLARFGYDREQAASQLEAAWSEAVPLQLRENSRAGLVRGGVLQVVVSHSAIAQELGFHKRDIVSCLQRLLPSEGITDIRCRVGAVS
jgi:predicted nucleic acid-binding Zn ribbon protein